MGIEVLVRRSPSWPTLFVALADGSNMADAGATIDIGVSPYSDLIERGVLVMDDASLAAALASAETATAAPAPPTSPTAATAPATTAPSGGSA